MSLHSEICGEDAVKAGHFLSQGFEGWPHQALLRRCRYNYTGKDMRKGHVHQVAKGLNGSHFDAVMENLGATLTELKVPANLIAQTAVVAESTRKDVLGRISPSTIAQLLH